MADFRVHAEISRQRFGASRLVVSKFQHLHGAAHDFGELRHAPPVSAVDQHQQAAIAGHQSAHRGFHGEGAGALQRHAHMAGFGVGDA